jgi:hypothetical protein
VSVSHFSMTCGACLLEGQIISNRTSACILAGCLECRDRCLERRFGTEIHTISRLAVGWENHPARPSFMRVDHLGIRPTCPFCNASIACNALSAGCFEGRAGENRYRITMASEVTFQGHRAIQSRMIKRKWAVADALAKPLNQFGLALCCLCNRHR